MSGRGSLSYTPEEEKNLSSLLDLMKCRTEICTLIPGLDLNDTSGRITLISTMSHRPDAEKKLCVAKTHFIAPPNETIPTNNSINNIINTSLAGAEQVGGIEARMALRNWREAVTRLAKEKEQSHIVVFSCNATSMSDTINNNLLLLDAGGHQTDLRTADQLFKDTYKSYLLILHLREVSGSLPTHIATTVTTSAPIIVSQSSAEQIEPINIIKRDTFRKT